MVPTSRQPLSVHTCFGNPQVCWAKQHSTVTTTTTAPAPTTAPTTAAAAAAIRDAEKRWKQSKGKLQYKNIYDNIDYLIYHRCPCLDPYHLIPLFGWILHECHQESLTSNTNMFSSLDPRHAHYPVCKLMHVSLAISGFKHQGCPGEIRTMTTAWPWQSWRTWLLNGWNGINWRIGIPIMDALAPFKVAS